MNEDELRKELWETVTDTKQLSQLVKRNLDLIDTLGRDLLEELRKIVGWEIMIDKCKDHYKQYPNEFFKWCSVDYSYSEKVIRFIKNYRDDDDDYVVLTIRLDIGLEEQVKRARELYG